MNNFSYITLSWCIMLSTIYGSDDSPVLQAPKISTLMSFTLLKQRKQYIKHAKIEDEIRWRNQTVCTCGPCSCTRDMLGASTTGCVYCTTCAASCAALHNTSCDPCVRATGPAIIAYMCAMGAHACDRPNQRRLDQELEEVSRALYEKKSQ